MFWTHVRLFFLLLLFQTLRTYRESLTGILWMSLRNLSTIVLTGFKLSQKGLYTYMYALGLVL